MALIDDVKKTLRVDGTDFDSELDNLIAEAKADLQLAGIVATKITDTDPLITGAVLAYCRSRFGFDSPEAERFSEIYENRKRRLQLAAEYTEVVS